MKKQILIVIAAFAVNAAEAQINDTLPKGDRIPSTEHPISGVPASVAPQVVVNKFNTNFPDMDETWQMDGNNYMAVYADKGTNLGRTITYDKNGNVVCSDSELDKASYPQKIRDYYAKNYPTASYKVWACRDNNGNRTYYSKHKSSTIWFNKKGDYVTTKPGTDKDTPKIDTP
jgi:hypothetical protein